MREGASSHNRGDDARRDEAAAGAPGRPTVQGSQVIRAAALAVEHGHDPAVALASWPHCGPLALDPTALVELLLEPSPGRTDARVPDHLEDWLSRVTRLIALLDALGEYALDPFLARRTAVRLALRLLEDHPAVDGPLGPVTAVTVDVQTRLQDLVLPEGVDRLLVRVVSGGVAVGTVLLPVVDGQVDAGDLADGIASELAWPLLGRWFAQTAWSPGTTDVDALHDRTGWDLLLQQVWDRPGLDGAAFYDPTATDGLPLRTASRFRLRSPGMESLEIADEAAWRAPPGRTYAVRVGGALLGTVATPGRVSSTAALRAATTKALGFELCRAVVREGLLGSSWNVPPTLSERLRRRAAEQRPAAGVRIGRPDRTAADRPTQRRTALPVAAGPDVLALAAALGQPVERDGTASLRYDPGLLPRGPHRLDERPVRRRPRVAEAQRLHDHFESLFAMGADPWAYDNAYEVEKYERTLSLLPGRPRRALELACAEGHFTDRLADRVDGLLATDVSETAVSRTEQRCAARTNVRTAVLDMLTDALPDGLDLVVCSEVLYYLPDIAALQALGRKVAGALVPGGHLLTAHAHLVVDDPDQTGFDWAHPFGARVISDVLAATPGLRLVRELRTPLYRICLYVRDDRPGGDPAVEHVAQVAPLPPASAARVRWAGGEVAEPTLTRVPILMYHRVAADGADWSRRYRVTPDELRQQLRHLRGEGYRSISLAAWASARASRQPLAERAVVLTFDDGYRDLLTEAWPLVEDHGYDINAFLVTDRMGGHNTWDDRWGERVPLLTWDEARQLERVGVRFGNHTCTHTPLTALDQATLVSDLARSRTALQRELAHPLPGIAYPFGDVDRSVLPFVGATGHLHGLTCRPGVSRHTDGALDLPRIEVVGGAGLRAFATSLAS